MNNYFICRISGIRHTEYSARYQKGLISGKPKPDIRQRICMILAGYPVKSLFGATQYDFLLFVQVHYLPHVDECPVPCLLLRTHLLNQLMVVLKRKTVEILIHNILFLFNQGYIFPKNWVFLPPPPFSKIIFSPQVQ